MAVFPRCAGKTMSQPMWRQLYNPIAEEECWIVLIETVTTQQTGDIETSLTKTV